MEWLSQNLGTIVVGVLLLLVIGLALRKLVRDKKQGKTCCGGSCSSCPGGCSGCNQAQK